MDFGGNIEEQKVFAMIAKPGSNFQYYAYFNPLKPVSTVCTISMDRQFKNLGSCTKSLTTFFLYFEMIFGMKAAVSS